MADFSGDIQNFQRYGTYTYKFDSEGNLTFDSGSSDFSRVYLSLPLRNVVYNNTKLEMFYDPTFVEFVPQSEPTQVEDTTGIQDQLNALEAENIALKNQLDSMTSQLEQTGTEADKLATKQVILELRKMLGQGRVDSDFSDDFPYSPIVKKASIVSDSENTSPKAGQETTNNVGGTTAPTETSTKIAGGSGGTTTTPDYIGVPSISYGGGGGSRRVPIKLN